MRQHDTDSFEASISAALEEDAERAPRLPEAWSGPRIATVRPLSRPTHRRLPILVGAAATLITIVAATIVIRTHDGETVPAAPPSSPAVWLPVGVEFPLVD